MQTEKYKSWLKLQKYQDNTITAQLHRTGRVEEHYGDLDEHFEKDRLTWLRSELSYSMNDKRANKPNPSKIPFDGDPYSNLASYRDSVNRYLKFRTDDTIAPEMDDDEEIVTTTPDSIDQGINSKQSISLERDMQAALRERIELLEEGLEITDEGAERSVDSGFIDITARDRSGHTVVIELKTGVASQRAVAQVLSYMGDVLNEQDGQPVRGILVASGFDSKARSAARVIPNLELRTYTVEFRFEDGG